ncbi:hypothetical protein PIB30_080388 [Stylosanthes scabra]|uniref:FAR1 domain-containing protein n=1 Tax=Stylosanthes scabra TaxID=79078 RepID=A0ABU6SRM2_9FABA|nr:hypothetical protein [Stylosanthes scabra]
MDARSYSSDSESATATESIMHFGHDVDEEYIQKAGMTFPSLEVAAAFYKEYAKRAGFSTKMRNTNRCRETKEIKNQLITCNREGKRISEIPYVEKTNPTCGANCPARIYVHHRELSMQVRCTIENNDQSGIRPNQTYQSLVNAAGGHNELGFIEKDVRNYITREIQNVSEEEDANELGNYFYRMKE